MGLDQYAFSKHGDGYYQWRKHAKLQYFMEDHWINDMKMQHSINGQPIRLTEDLIVQLQRMVDTDELPTRMDGFFYGQDYQDESAEGYKEYDLQFCDWALKELQDGNDIYYECSY